MTNLRSVQRPETTEEAVHILRAAGAHGQTVSLCGAGSKRLMGGPIEDAAVNLSMAGMNRVIEYEPRDLTIGVEAGMPWRDLTQLAAGNGQVIPLDPPYGADATVGGVVATNASGPRRRLYGTARDMVIGMKFLTLEGKIVQSGGMVVKNVAGLDMAKLLIGSYGTLAAILSVNFKLIPAPAAERSFLLGFDSAAQAASARDGVLKSVLQPSAVDLLNPAAGAALGKRAWLLALRVGGNANVIERYEREFAALGEGVALDGGQHEALWQRIQEYSPQWMERHPEGAVVRASCTLKEVEGLLATFDGPAVVRAGSGVAFLHFERLEPAAAWAAEAARHGWRAVVEFSPEGARREIELWPAPGNDWEIMRRVKEMFDPHGLLNRGRLYRRI